MGETYEEITVQILPTLSFDCPTFGCVGSSALVYASFESEMMDSWPYQWPGRVGRTESTSDQGIAAVAASAVLDEIHHC